MDEGKFICFNLLFKSGKEETIYLNVDGITEEQLDKITSIVATQFNDGNVSGYLTFPIGVKGGRLVNVKELASFSFQEVTVAELREQNGGY